MIVSLRLDEGKRLVGVIVTPFGLRLSEGVQIIVGETPIARFNFDTCVTEGCIVIIALGDKEIQAMRAGIEGQINMMARNGNTVGLPLSLLGFSAALARLSELTGE